MSSYLVSFTYVETLVIGLALVLSYKDSGFFRKDTRERQLEIEGKRRKDDIR